MENKRPQYDVVLQTLADYLLDETSFNETTLKTAQYCLLDSLGCALLALNDTHCRSLLNPPTLKMPFLHGADTHYQTDPVHAAFNIGTLIRWLDYNDTWLAAEWGHPSDNLGAILAISDYLQRCKGVSITVLDVLNCLVKAYEIQGVLALDHALNAFGFDHVFLVKLASTAVVMRLMNKNRESIMDALSQVFMDGPCLRTYRHAPNTSSRKSWAAGDATSRGVRLALLTHLGEKGAPNVITQPTWGFSDVYLKGQPFALSQPLASYVMDRILFKVFPAEFHAQTAVEAALKLHAHYPNQLKEIAKIKIETQHSAMRIINKTGPLHNPADRDHCLQYMVAVALSQGQLGVDDYSDNAAQEHRIDDWRDKMYVSENAQFSQDYLDPEKRSIANSVQLEFNNGQLSEKVVIHYPAGHPNRRGEALPMLRKKFLTNGTDILPRKHIEKLMEVFDTSHILEWPIDRLLRLFEPA